MNSELLATLEYIEQDRGINKEQLVETIENAVLSTVRSKKVVILPENAFVKLDLKSGAMRVWAKLEVVEFFPEQNQISLEKARQVKPDAAVGEFILCDVTPADLGRIAIHAIRQSIQQALRNAEKEIVREEYQDKVGEIVNGTVKRMEAGSIIVDLQKFEGIIPAQDKVPGELYMVGERINALLVKVDTTTKGPSLILSRTNKGFVKKLFEREVTEMHDGVVEIAGIAREAGLRTKIAVRSNDPRVDPVGACVGMRGMRVRNITGELGKERVDIIRYDDDIRVYIANALHPAKLGNIEVDHEHRMLTISVDQENSRLAYGKKAQNVRLAQKLTGYNINFVEENEEEESFEDKKDRIIEQLSEALNIAPVKAEILVNNGYLSMDGLKTAGMKDISCIEGMDEESLASIAAALETFESSEDTAE